MASSSPRLKFTPIRPIISCIQKIVVYETKARFFIIGANNTETRFRVLKIDRTEPSALNITDDRIEYSQRQIRDLLRMIDSGNRNRQGNQKTKSQSGLLMTVSSFGIVGFIRFLSGYYMVLITKRRKVAVIGPHTIYKIEDTTMVYIPSESNNSHQHPDENRYLKMFQNIDLSSNFYYSYSYDLTHTLQYNMAPCQNLSTRCGSQLERSHECSISDHRSRTSCCQEGEVEDAKTSITGFSSIVNLSDKSPEENVPVYENDEALDQVYGIRQKPTKKYVWNDHLLHGFEEQVHYDWVMYIIHGFLGQCNLNVYGRSLYLTLIARRSKEYAGTRFLKRGANSEGNVANEVETEQIVQDCSTLAYDKMRHFSSFVQHRGSVPLFWSQDVSKMVPKPPIQMDLLDPYSYVSGVHFNSLLRRYGAPIIILNLVKKREKKPHESILIDDFVVTVNFLNQFLSPEFAMQYIGFDMARMNKSKNANVLTKLAGIADVVVKKVGFFHTGPLLRKGRSNEGIMREQEGVLRTNCVDCLDRTNTAQFVVGKCALAHQLHDMNVLEKPSLEFDTDCVRMLEELYEDHGDTLALQYGGSQLVHRIQTYRKIAPWTSHSRDIMQTLSRYYSNTFSDAEKQQAINLFLGVFHPTDKGPAIWDLPTDYYYHNAAATLTPPLRTKWYSQWWDTDVMECLPKPRDEVKKSVSDLVAWFLTDDQDERVNCYWDHYKPYELTTLDELFCLNMTHSIRDFMPKFAADSSPFAVRIRPGRRQEESGKTGNGKNPSISGKESTSSLGAGENSSGSGSDGSDIEGDFHYIRDITPGTPRENDGYVRLQDIFPTMRNVYGVDLRQPKKLDILLYKRHAQIGRNATRPLEETEDGVRIATKGTTIIQSSPFSLDSSYHVTPPQVSKASKEIYRNHVEVGKFGAKNPSPETVEGYRKFVSSRYR